MPNKLQKKGRKPVQVTNCKHVDRKHFAKGMCNHCYHRYGRSSPATECEHSDRQNYAKGMCQNCYLKIYNRKKRLAKRIKKLAEASRMPIM